MRESRLHPTRAACPFKSPKVNPFVPTWTNKKPIAAFGGEYLSFGAKASPELLVPMALCKQQTKFHWMAARVFQPNPALAFAEFKSSHLFRHG